MNECLTKAIEEKPNFKLAEKIVNGKNQFHFFPVKVAMKAQEKEDTKNATKIKRTI
jgi:hypothetical protein